MRHLLLIVVVFCFGVSIFSYHSALAQEVGHAQVQIENPLADAVVQGLVPITISTNLENSVYSELSFTYHQNETGTWFVIWEGEDELPNGELTVWDTTAITDGNYDLRLLVWTNDEEQKELIVSGIRVRNYSPIETNTPDPRPSITPQTTQEISATQMPTLEITYSPNVTPGPNPASLNQDQIMLVVLRASAGVFAVFLLAGGYFFVRSLLRGKR